ncbi:protein LAZY 1-like [Apium graveolens]|uniref:protein LAZY 1-like n=1 Tax=Apium graveolens TaxID=4045 RepID=UPI003D78FE43
MTLLGWMHRKLRQNSGETLKEFSIGQQSLDKQQHYYSKPNYCSTTLSKTQRDNHPRKSYSSLKSAGNKDLGEEPYAFSELSHGFLAIGTLGADQVIADPLTPIYSISVESLTDEETGVTESELRLINEELVKVLGADCYKSSGTSRNSHANAGRSSQGSTITLSGKPVEGTENSVNGPITCPLQGYLLGTAMGMPETTVPKKIHKTSLGELFQKTKMAEENSEIKYEIGEKRAEKEEDRSAAKLLKKLLKKKTIHASSRSSTSSGGTTDSATAYKKRTKILRMFHRKVHPEITAETEKIDKLQENGKVKNMSEGINSDANQLHPDKDITTYHHRLLSREGTGPCKSQSNLPLGTLDANDSYGNREHWIKTDTNYLVLEL